MNIISLKNSAMGYTFRAMVPSGIGDSWDGSYVDDGQPSGGLIGTSSNPTSGKVKVETGQDQYGNPIWGEQDAQQVAGLKPSYEAGQEINYVKDLQDTLVSGTGQKAASLETGEDTWQGYQPKTQENFTPEQAVELYNRMDPRLANDPAMAAQLAKANQYFAKEGNFLPGGEGATAKNLTDFMAQDKIDAASRQAATQAVGLSLVGGIAGGAMLAGAGAGSAGTTALGAEEAVGTVAGNGADMGAMSAAEAAAQNGALAQQLGGYASSEVAGAAGAASSSGATSSFMDSVNQFLGSPVGKLVAGQGVGLAAKAMGGGSSNNQSGLINSTQNTQQNSQNATKPTVINYYGTPASQSTAKAESKPIQMADANMFSSGTGWGSAISSYQKSKLGA